MTGFWRNWMTIWCLSITLFGVILAAGGIEATSAPMRLFFLLLDGPEPLDLNAQMRFAVGVCGPVTIGWSLTLLGAMHAANELGPRGRTTWLWITAGVSSWFVCDSLLSLHTGYGRNVLPNILYITTFLLPVWKTGVLRRH